MIWLIQVFLTELAWDKQQDMTAKKTFLSKITYCYFYKASFYLNKITLQKYLWDFFLLKKKDIRKKFGAKKTKMSVVWKNKI